MKSSIEKLQNMIDSSDNIVFFGGAGVSTDSGLKDFKGKNGLYTTSKEELPEYLLSCKCFHEEPEKFFDNYKKMFNCLNVQPNITHKYLAKLESTGKLKGIITQNVDGLHQKAGSKKVYEIHGTISKNYCLKCNKEYDAEYIFKSNGIPKCSCGGIIKPKVVLYGEMLSDDYTTAQYLIYKADMLIVAGTSLTVEPANGLVNIYSGNKLVIINDSETPFDYKANLVLHENLKEVFSNLKI